MFEIQTTGFEVISGIYAAGFAATYVVGRQNNGDRLESLWGAAWWPVAVVLLGLIGLIELFD